MKSCNHCGKLKPEEEFNWRHKALGIRQGACKVCKAKHDKKWYKKRKECHIKNTNELRKARIQKARQYVMDYLLSHPCVDCGETNPTVLEFDHVRGKKTKTIAELVGQGYSIAAIQKEIAKCVVRCANCHRIKTAEDNNWYDW